MTDIFSIVERRAKPRVETKVRVRLQDFGGELVTFSGNLSKSGVFLETHESLGKVGDKIQMDMRLPNASDDVKVIGKIARVITSNQFGSVSGIGIEFLKIEARQVRTFERLIDRLMDARGIGSRHYPRVKTQVFVELKLKEKSLKAISDNLSKGGLFLKMSVEGLVLGDVVNLVILHPTTKRRFAIDAEVVHVRKGDSAADNQFFEGIGIQFAEMTPTRRNDMTLFLRSIVSSQKKATS